MEGRTVIVDSGQPPARPGPPAAARRAWPDRLRLPLAVDLAGLRTDLAGLDAGEWTRHFVPQHYEGEWSVLALRALAGSAGMHPILRIAPRRDCRDWEDTPLFAACPGIRATLAALRCPLEAVRLMRLAPGSVIKPHRDDDLTAEEGAARLHIPVTTNPGVDFRLNGTRIDMAAGSVWYLRLADPHAVTNGGTTARVHLVIDTIVNDWLATKLDEAAAPPGDTSDAVPSVVLPCRGA